MSKSAAKTGAGPTVVVAIEQFFPKNQRIIEDPMAFRMLPFGVRMFVQLVRPDFMRDWMVRATEKDLPGIWAGMMCRKRFIDDALVRSADHFDAVVNLGAGFDTRVYRIASASRIPVWEVDQKENIAAKKRGVINILAAIPRNVRLVSIDFDREKLVDILLSHGYSTAMRTFFIWEGVTQYLTDAGIQSTFEFLGAAPARSQVVFTYIRRDFLDGRTMYGWNKAYRKYVARERVWLFGKNPEEWPDFLNLYGWKVVDDIGIPDLTEQYVKPTGRVLPGNEVERILVAEKVH
jgi:methyltransferase (TIGR00027 family)